MAAATENIQTFCDEAESKNTKRQTCEKVHHMGDEAPTTRAWLPEIIPSELNVYIRDFIISL